MPNLRPCRPVALLALILACPACAQPAAVDTPPLEEVPQQQVTPDTQNPEGGTIDSDVPEQDVQPADTETLELEEHFEQVFFGPDGEAYFEDGVMHLDRGDPLTGVVFNGDIDELLGEDWDNYEVTFEAQRVEGYDFFVCFTFPVGHEGNVSLVLGGWGGSVVGISSLDGRDAANNATTRMGEFSNETWYTVSVRVTPQEIVCSRDGEELFTVDRSRYERFSVRNEVTLCEPFGFASFRTHAAIRNLTVTQLPAEEQ